MLYCHVCALLSGIEDAERLKENKRSYFIEFNVEINKIKQ